MLKRLITVGIGWLRLSEVTEAGSVRELPYQGQSMQQLAEQCEREGAVTVVEDVGFGTGYHLVESFQSMYILSPILSMGDALEIYDETPYEDWGEPLLAAFEKASAMKGVCVEG